ncbi:hypothetical protein BASA81_017440 [Batrachochytrium salamandrivorans]|nr:hypothetical protein BASA81_017440 [Batrachochytrium salamandrivorans]
MAAELGETKIRLQMEQAQLRELRIRMAEVQKEQVRLQVAKPQQVIAVTLQAAHLVFSNSLLLWLFVHFEEFLHFASKAKVNKLHSLVFMRNVSGRRCDSMSAIGGNPRTSTKKLFDAIVAHTCFVEQMSLDQRRSSRHAIARQTQWLPRRKHAARHPRLLLMVIVIVVVVMLLLNPSISRKRHLLQARDCLVKRDRETEHVSPAPIYPA